MDFDLSAVYSKLAIVFPYLSYLVSIFTKMFETMEQYFNS